MRAQLVVQAPLPPPPAPKQGPGFHGAVTEFKRRLIEATLVQLGGNRTRTARALGLQRTYLLRLMREFGVNVPRVEAAARPNGGVPASGGNDGPRRPPSSPPAR
jgi:DNA-binding NtrC family response regulator